MARLRYLQNKRSGTAGTIVKSTSKLHFYDDGMYIYASADGVLEIVADTSITLTAPTVNVAVTATTAFTDPITIDFDCTASSVSDLTITSSSSSTSGSVVIKPLYVDATMSATGGLGRAIEGKLTVSGKLGDYGNAIKGYTDLTGGTGCAGLVSAICAEMKMPATTALGTHTVLEIELVTPASAVIQQGIGANCTSFIRARVSGNVTAVQSFNDYGYLLDLQGLTSATTDLLYENTLKCAIGSTKYYLLMSTAEGSFTTSRPIVTTFGTIAIDISTCTTGIDITAATTGINLNGTMTTAITIGDGATTGISITGATNYAVDIQTTGHFRMGTGPAGTEVGIPVTTAAPHTMEVYTEPGSTPLTAATSSFGIRSRYLIHNAQTQVITVEAVDARMRIKSAVTQGIYTGVQGYIEVSGSPAINPAQMHAGGFTVDIDTGTTVSGGYISGVHIDSATNGSVGVGSATYSALRISTGTGGGGREPWTYGILMEDDDAVTGIQIGDCTTGIALDGDMATGIALAGTYSVAGITVTSSFAATGDYGILVTDTYTKVDGNHDAITGVTIYTPSGDAGYGWINAVSGKVTLTASDTFSGSQGGLFGGQFQLDFGASSVMDQDNSIFAGVRGVITGNTPVCTNASVLACCYLDNLSTQDLSGFAQYGSALLSMQNHGGAMDHAISIFSGTTLTNLFAIYGTPSFVQGGVATGPTKKLAILIGTTTYYINVYQ